MRAWESTRTPSLRKSTSCSIVALRNSSESPILSSSAIVVSSCSVDWSLPKEPHGGRLRQQPLSLTHSRGHYPARVAVSSCKLLGGDGPIAQQVGVREARRGDLPTFAPPQ